MTSISYETLSSLAEAPHIARGMARAALRLALRRRTRLSGRVTEEYDQGYWSRVLRDRAWERTPTLEAFLLGDDTSERVARVHSRSVRIRTRDYYSYRMEALAEIVERHAGRAGEIVELGCGYGYNMFSLALSGAWRLVGFDVSENAINAARSIAGRFGLEERIEFGLLDITCAEAPNFSRVTGRVVLTHFCLEQLPYALESVVRTLLAHRPARVIHVESAAALLSLWRPRDLLNYLYVRSMDYQTQLFSLLRRLERDGLLRIVACERSPYAPTLQNDGCVIVWEPRY
jgi:SAM-dependent methyltransferase